ncbi:DedA family protein [Shewanella oneidensis MR-1]|uniref:Membrane protein n=1 Tax=Shewanella oneidensis (strain ATCC 700550 / JCM 31522 / CIP 106686 / LMG 19005 / NCIMB 14063 / MR-1) TaxID=211586 RepID=Q8EBF7_SHEON|nr:YqaA family protein [Shewanella oneidensis]AAN56552.1 membrane protein [Shewanella oneidensis MR-1]MDX5999046.1 YqaA family protein [Shewanella oneidensis]MEE2029195.1 Inner membrane protein YqaA [Shewanella oneidensis]QKG97929.1 DedA family protein [Shewanella oneidensis MR-1]
MSDLIIMFSGAFLAATLLPGGSEVLLVGLLNKVPQAWLSLVAVASMGNTLGAMTSFYLGRLGRFAKSPEALSEGKHAKALTLIERYGVWSLLLSWAPIIGDVLCLLAGWLKLPMRLALIVIFIGKTVRYLVVAAATLHWLG